MYQYAFIFLLGALVFGACENGKLAILDDLVERYCGAIEECAPVQFERYETFVGCTENFDLRLDYYGSESEKCLDAVRARMECELTHFCGMTFENVCAAEWATETEYCLPD